MKGYDGPSTTPLIWGSAHRKQVCPADGSTLYRTSEDARWKCPICFIELPEDWEFTWQ